MVVIEFGTMATSKPQIGRQPLSFRPYLVPISLACPCIFYQNIKSICFNQSPGATERPQVSRVTHFPLPHSFHEC